MTNSRYDAIVVGAGRASKRAIQGGASGGASERRLALGYVECMNLPILVPAVRET